MTTMRHYALFLFLCSMSIALLVGGFLVPPMGVIDGSVLKGSAIVFGFAALYVILRAVDKGVGAKLEHGDTKLTISDDKE